MRAATLAVLCFLPALALAAAPAAKAPPAPAAPAGDPFDISAFKDKLKVLGDGKGHFLVLIEPYSLEDREQEHLFYGDGKTFWEQRRTSGGRSGADSWYRAFWDPRQKPTGSPASLSLKDKAYKVDCDARETTLTPVTGPEAEKMIAEGKFFKRRWKHQAVALARDESGVYFYVDRPLEPRDNKLYRVFRGKRGEAKMLPMTNIVDDSGGTIFETRQGSLRLVLGKTDSEHFWTAGKQKVKLKLLPVEENVPLIYSELGAYAGMPLGTPCDDL